MRTYTGREINPLDLRIEDIDILDIAHHTSCVGRFNGATRWHYSSAQHAVYVSRQFKGVSWRMRLAGLLHDATDAYFPDVPTPIKHSTAFEFFRVAEKEALTLVFARFGADMGLMPEVKKADLSVMVSEGIQLMDHRYDFALPAYTDGGFALQVERLTPDEAKNLFLTEFRDIISQPDFDGRT